nr:maleylpyruvate isomerase family mycothiol-dependent enzyme [Corynebacterium lactis]
MTNFHDLPIEERLSLVRRGTAHYSGQLALIDNEDFQRPTLLEGWNVATLAAHVAYNANALCNLMHWAETGEETPMYASPTARNEEIARGATLRPDAIRNLHDHTLVRLDVAWRDATEQAWQAEVRTAQGRTVPASETLWMRAREVWIHAVDLKVKAAFEDIPEVILRTLLPEIAGKWRSGGVGSELALVDASSGNRIEVSPGSATVEVHGDLPGLVRWATGRGGEGVRLADGSAAPEPPRWL